MKISTLLEAGKPVFLDHGDADDVESIRALLMEKAPAAFAAFKENKQTTIYRGVSHTNQDLFIQDTRASVRRSENTSNYVTLSSSFLSSWGKLPARSAGNSCTSNLDMAVDYGYAYVAVPTADADIVYCGDDDFWTALPNLRTIDMDVSQFNEGIAKSYQILMSEDGCPNNIETPEGLAVFYQFISDVCEGKGAQKLAQVQLINCYLDSDADNFPDYVNHLLTPGNFRVTKGSNVLVGGENEEVFISGTIIFVAKKVWDSL